MEFEQMIHGEKFNFSAISNKYYLVSGPGFEYILYKTTKWECADEISDDLLKRLGAAIESHTQVGEKIR